MRQARRARGRGRERVSAGNYDGEHRPIIYTRTRTSNPRSSIDRGGCPSPQTRPHPSPHPIDRRGCLSSAAATRSAARLPATGRERPPSARPHPSEFTPTQIPRQRRASRCQARRGRCLRRSQLAGHLVELNESPQLRSLEEGREGKRERNGDELVPVWGRRGAGGTSGSRASTYQTRKGCLHPCRGAGAARASQRVRPGLREDAQCDARAARRTRLAEGELGGGVRIEDGAEGAIRRRVASLVVCFEA